MLVVEVTEVMLIIMTIMIAMGLVQIDLEEASIIVFHECLTTDMGMDILLSRAQHWTLCIHHLTKNY